MSQSPLSTLELLSRLMEASVRMDAQLRALRGNMADAWRNVEQANEQLRQMQEHAAQAQENLARARDLKG